MAYCHRDLFRFGHLPTSRRHSKDKSTVVCTSVPVRYGSQKCTTFELNSGKQHEPALPLSVKWPSDFGSGLGVSSGQSMCTGFARNHARIRDTHFGVSCCSASKSESDVGIPSELRSPTMTATRGRQKREETESSSFPPLPLVESITSPSNTFIKHCVKLRTSSAYRKAAKSLVVVGSTPLREILSTTCSSTLHLLFIREGSSPPPSLSTNPLTRIIRVSDTIMARLVGMDSPEGVDVVGLMSLPEGFVDLGMGREGWVDGKADGLAAWSGGAKRVLALDGIQDPGNLGTLLRTAAAFAWDGVFLLPGCCDPFNDKALRASRGCIFRLPLIVGEWDDLMTWSKSNNFTLFAADPADDNDTNGGIKDENVVGLSESIGSGSTLNTACMEDKICLVLGSEGQGLSQSALQLCTRIAIPMPGGVESLNVAIAGGILLYLLKYQALPKS